MSGAGCCFLTCMQISQEASKVVWYSHLFKKFPQFLLIHAAKGFGVINKTEVDAFLEFSCFFYDTMDVGNLISGSFAFYISRLNTWKFTIHILLKPGLEDFENYFTSMWDECNCAIVWTFFGINKLWKILKKMGIPNHLTCLLRNLYAGQEATVRIEHGTTDWFQIRKGVCQGCVLSPCLFNLYAEYIMWNDGLDEAQAGIKTAGRNISNLRYADDITIMAESEEELKSLLMKVKEESEKLA